MQVVYIHNLYFLLLRFDLQIVFKLLKIISNDLVPFYIYNENRKRKYHAVGSRFTLKH